MVTVWALATAALRATRSSAGLSVRPRSNASGVCDRGADDDELVPEELVRDRAPDDFVAEVWTELPDPLRGDPAAEAAGAMAFGVGRVEPWTLMCVDQG